MSNELGNFELIFERRNKVKDRLIDVNRCIAAHQNGVPYIASAKGESAEEQVIKQQLEDELTTLDRMLEALQPTHQPNNVKGDK